MKDKRKFAIGMVGVAAFVMSTIAVSNLEEKYIKDRFKRDLVRQLSNAVLGMASVTYCHYLLED